MVARLPPTSTACVTCSSVEDSESFSGTPALKVVPQKRTTVASSDVGIEAACSVTLTTGGLVGGGQAAAAAGPQVAA